MENGSESNSSSDGEISYNNQDSRSSFSANISTYNTSYYSSRPSNLNMYANDGSFLEMFKKMQEASQKESEASEARYGHGSGTEQSQDGEKKKNGERKTGPTFVSKRRGGKILKTGMVKKLKTNPKKEEEKPTDAWSRYLEEVKKYKQHACEDDSRMRPLVK
ncbi:telomerase RNA component interacting RNase-like isoform X1 [Tachypleus tridentatus]|uniref:telomerase RNA component interacting RNase-like isoform X1 n=1 Tax=Tachypleus tridentatus TaxID=6853 RepID=UPI003FD04304